MILRNHWLSLRRSTAAPERPGREGHGERPQAPGPEVGAALHLEMQVRLRRVPGVAAAADRVARSLYGDGAKAHELVRRGRKGEPEAVEALAGIGRYLGAGIAGFVNVFEPEVVVVGGGFGEAGELLLGPAREIVAVEGLEPARDTVRIVEAELGIEAGVIGAGLVAFEALGAEG